MPGVVRHESQIIRKGYGGDLRVQRADAHSGILQNAINSSIFISCGIVKGQTVVARKKLYCLSRDCVGC